MVNLALLITSYSIPFWLCIGLIFGGPFLFLPVVNILILHPLFDALISKYIPNTKKLNLFRNLDGGNSFSYKILLAYPIIQFCILLVCIIKLTTLDIAGYEFWMITATAGMMCGAVGLTMAHDLMHGKTKLPRYAALALTLMSSNTHWLVEHVLGHHKRVATPEDPATSRKNESMYVFVARSTVMQFVSAIKLKRNQVLKHLSLQVLIYITIGLTFGVKGIIFFAIQSLISISILEQANYIEHYGLLRKKLANGKYEKVNPTHSWDCHSLLTNISMFNLGFHADHHANINKDYRSLEATNKSRIMPFGISAQLIMASIPPLWFKVMNPLVDKVNEVNFTESLIPELKVSLINLKYPELKNKIINQNLYRYLSFTQTLETEVINKFIRSVLEKQENHPLMDKMPLDICSSFVERSFQIYEEEIEHADSVKTLEKNIIERTGQLSNTLNKPSSLTQLSKELEYMFDEKFRDLALFSFVYVSETLISRNLSKLALDKNLYKPISNFMRHHLIDEVKHSQFFGEFLIELWPTLDRTEQSFVQTKINQYKNLFLCPDIKAISYELLNHGVTAHDTAIIAQELKDEFADQSFFEQSFTTRKYLDQAIKTQQNIYSISVGQ